MLRQYELVDRVLDYDPDADEALLNRAYVFSMHAHGSQKRASGDPYFSHPIEVAGILTDLHLDAETIATAILHDTIEDTVATPEEIAALVAVFSAIGGEEPRSERSVSEWNSPYRQVRPFYSHGPGGWRSSGLPKHRGRGN